MAEVKDSVLLKTEGGIFHTGILMAVTSEFVSSYVDYRLKTVVYKFVLFREDRFCIYSTEHYGNIQIFSSRMVMIEKNRHSSKKLNEQIKNVGHFLKKGVRMHER